MNLAFGFVDEELNPNFSDEEPDVAPDCPGTFEEDLPGMGDPSASSSDVPPPPPPPPPGGGAVRGPRRPAPDAEAVWPGGKICFYRSNGNFVGVCGNFFHGKCFLTRKFTRAAKMQGRPLGLIAAWLEAGQHLAGKEAHGDFVEPLVWDPELRVATRDRLKLTIGETHELFLHERPREADEPLEPLFETL